MWKKRFGGHDAQKTKRANMRVVIDTNVIVSGFFFGGIPAAVLRLAESGTVTACFTTETLAEANRILAQKEFEKYRQQLSYPVATMLEALARTSLHFPTPADIPSHITSDPSDNHFLACAQIANAQYIISGDKHLLNLKKFARIPIVTPRQFLRRFK